MRFIVLKTKLKALIGHPSPFIDLVILGAVAINSAKYLVGKFLGDARAA